MRFFRRSITRKLFVHLFLVALLVGAAYFYLIRSGEDNTVFKVLAISLLILVILFTLIYFVDVARPMKIILVEMQALISGKPYKRIYTDRIDEVGIIAHFFNQVTKGLGEVSFDIKDRERMMGELNVASQLQRDILPTKAPNVSGLQIVAKNRPATELGGDSFNFIRANNKTYIYVGDVTGHGVAAGLIMSMVNSLINVFANVYGSAYEVLVNVNKYIKEHVKKAMYMTMVMLCWDDVNKKMTYVGAGHEHILIYRADTGECEAILSGGVALGMVPDSSKVISEKELDISADDTVVLYSDGIIEARNNNNELFGLERLRELVVEYAPQYSAEGVNYHIAKDVTAFMGQHIQDDDMTLIVIRRDDTSDGQAKVQDLSTNWNA